MEQLLSMLRLQGDKASTGNPAAGSSSALPTAAEGSKKKASAKKEDHMFWKSQPVPDVGEDVTENGPYEPDKKPEEIRQVPYTLPDGYEWTEIDVESEAEVFLLSCLYYYYDNYCSPQNLSCCSSRSSTLS
jgi:hypothetical protein